MTERPDIEPDETPEQDQAATDAEAPETVAGDEPDEELAPAPSPEELLTAERDELKERWLRAAAELENVRKRSRREVADARRFAQADLLRSLLEVADNFERALGSMAGDDEVTADGVREGVELIHQRFLTVLRDRGVETVEALGKEFDPNWHEAVGQLPAEDAEAGTVLEVVQQGYRFGDLVLRPARVIIAA
jgi:molecular chaperone GrpE